MDLKDYHWLVSGPTQRRLENVAEDARPTLQIAATLRKDLTAVRTHLLLEQVELRKRARLKFPAADRMFFTRKGLEQATDIWLARHKAQRYVAGSVVADLCCGIGGDLLALAERGGVVAVERDPVIGLLAEANVGAVGLNSTVRLTNADATSISLTQYHAWHIDPDRRPTGDRRTQLKSLEPNGEALGKLLQDNGNASWKLAPATELPDNLKAKCEVEWVSRDGECRQQIAWFGELARRIGQSAATVLSREGNSLRTIVGTPGIPPVGALSEYLYEPDAAILAARLAAAVAENFNLNALQAGCAYLTGGEPIDDPALVGFKVIEAMPFDRKKLIAWLAARAIGTVEVKSRDRRIDANVVQRQLAARGAGKVTVLFAPIQDQTWAIIAERVGKQ